MKLEPVPLIDDLTQQARSEERSSIARWIASLTGPVDPGELARRLLEGEDLR
jgi:hypothetical protein